MSEVKKRSIIVRGHKTSVSLEDSFWTGLKEIAEARGSHLGQLVAELDSERDASNLSSALRVFVLKHYRARAEATEAGAAKEA
jgi:predicted DNA-binding ribbon-helix-helix protein